jgi:sulfite reductase (NADPH) flavoprotein alpha-component
MDSLEPTKTFPTAAAAIEHLASRANVSSTVFVYDLAEHVGFGVQTLAWAKEDGGAAPAIAFQTRDGAGLGLVGRLSQGSSKNAGRGTAVTAYTTPTGLAAIIPSLAYLPAASSSGRLVLQVSIYRSLGSRFRLT